MWITCWTSRKGKEQASCVNEKNVFSCLKGMLFIHFFVCISALCFVFISEWFTLIFSRLTCCYATGCFLGIRHSSGGIQMSEVSLWTCMVLCCWVPPHADSVGVFLDVFFMISGQSWSQATKHMASTPVFCLPQTGCSFWWCSAWVSFFLDLLFFDVKVSMVHILIMKGRGKMKKSPPVIPSMR